MYSQLYVIFVIIGIVSQLYVFTIVYCPPLLLPTCFNRTYVCIIQALILANFMNRFTNFFRAGSKCNVINL